MIIKNIENLLIFEFLLLISLFGKILLIKERLLVKDVDADFRKCIIIFLGSILCCSQSGDDPQGDLARFGY
jgi:hypothetical protein